MSSSTMALSFLSTFSFGQPAWFLLLLLLPSLLRRWSRPGPQPAIPFSSLKILTALPRPPKPASGVWRLLLRTLVLVTIITALARPRVEKTADEQQATGIDIMLVVDCSESMDSRDFDLGAGKVSRLEALRQVMASFIKDRPRDRIGIIGFAEKPFLISPLTLDHSWMMEALSGVKTALGTAFGSGLESAVDLLATAGDRTKIALLVTDGLNTSGADPMEAATLARRRGVRVYTIGVVTYNEMQTKNLDELILYRIGRMTGGNFFQAANAEALQGIYRQIDQLERTQFKQPKVTEYRELFAWIVLLAFTLLAADLIWNHTRRLSLP